MWLMSNLSDGMQEHSIASLHAQSACEFNRTWVTMAREVAGKTDQHTLLVDKFSSWSLRKACP